MEKLSGWAEVRTFKDVDGREIIQFEILDGKDKGKNVYKGKVLLTIRTNPDTRVPPQRMPFEFDFPDGKNLEWAKKNFDIEAEKAVKEWELARKEASKQIIPANTLPTIFGATGKKV